MLRFLALVVLVACGIGCDAQKAKKQLRSKGVEPGIEAMFSNVREGKLEEVRLLLRAGIGVNAEEKLTGQTPLIAAADRGQIEVMKLLLESGANPNAAIIAKEFRSGLPLPGWESSTVRPNPGWTPLLFAVKRQNREAVELLLKSGAKPELISREMSTPPLFMAAHQGDLPMVKALLAGGAKPDVEGPGGATPFLAAANLPVRKALLTAGADLKRKDAEGKSALWYAIARFDTNSLQFLIHEGLDVNERDRRGNPLLFHAYGVIRKILVDAGADVKARNAEGLSLAQFAARDARYHNNILDWWRLGASVEGLAPHEASHFLSDAVEERNLPAMKAALDAGADPNARFRNSTTLLAYMAGEKFNEGVRLLIDRGADVNAAPYEGISALRQAALTGNREAVELLLKKGADPLRSDKSGRVPADYAEQRGFKDIVNLLKSARPPQ